MKVTNVTHPSLDDVERLQLLADLAEAFYVDDLTQMEIAEKFSLARPTISRLLAEARQKGIVEFKIHRVFQSDPGLAARIMQEFGIGKANVVVLPERDQALAIPGFGRFAAEVVHALLRPESVMGVTLGSTVSMTVDALSNLSPLPIKIVQLCGSVGAADPALDAHAIVRKLSQAYGCEGVYFHGPFLVDSQDVRDSLRRNQSNQTCLELGRRADLALFGVGSIDTTHSSLYRGGHVPKDEVLGLQERGAIGDIGGFNIDADGRLVEGSGAFWFSGIDFKDFLNIPERVGVARGTQKVRQIKAALKGGLINHLITDRATALALFQNQE